MTHFFGPTSTIDRRIISLYPWRTLLLIYPDPDPDPLCLECYNTHNLTQAKRDESILGDVHWTVAVVSLYTHTPSHGSWNKHVTIVSVVD